MSHQVKSSPNLLEHQINMDGSISSVRLMDHLGVKHNQIRIPRQWRIPILTLRRLLLAALSLTLVGCGGGGGGGGGGGSDGAFETTGETFWITSPTSYSVYETDRDTVFLEGTSFVPEGASCHPKTMPPGYDVTWSNSANGLSRSSMFDLSCFLFVHVDWWAGIPLELGSNAITVTASDATGRMGQGKIEVIRVKDTTPPTVMSIKPLDGSVNVAVNASMEVTFSENMNHESINATTITLTNNIGNVIPAFVVYYSYNQTATITPSIPLGYTTLYQITVTTAVQDEAGNPPSMPLLFSFTTGSSSDTNPPYIESVSPPPDSICAPLSGVISASFNEELESSTVNESTFILTNSSNESIPGIVSYLERVASFTPYTGLPAETQFTATLTTNIEDLSQNPMSSNYQWNFETTTAGGVGSWTPTDISGAPFPRYGHVAVWTGNEMVISGGWALDTNWHSFEYTSQYGRYNPATGSWMVSTGAPQGLDQKAVWTGSKMLLWGGYQYGSALATGRAYDPADDSWSSLSQLNQPSARYDHTVVWTGSEMLVWGGRGGPGRSLGDGARYDTTLDSWVSIQSSGAPLARYGHSAVWTGSEMIIWGGISATGTFLRDGARYNPQTDVWTPISEFGAPSERSDHVAVWTGSEMIVWGGVPGSNTGGRYNPSSDTWTPTDNLCAPTGRSRATAVWTGSKMIIWGGSKTSSLDDGSEYDPVNDSWQHITIDSAPTSRSRHTAVWSGSKMIIWGGYDGGVLQDGGILTP